MLRTKMWKTVLAVAVTAVVVFVAGSPKNVHAGCDSGQFQAILDDVFNNDGQGSLPSTVGYSAVVKSPSCIWAGAIGKANINRFEPHPDLTVAHRMVVGSLTKMFTAHLTLGQIDAGTLTLSDMVSEFFTPQELANLSAGCTADCPDFSATIHDLLDATHTFDDFVVANRDGDPDGFPDTFQMLFRRLLQFIGKPTVPDPGQQTALDLLTAVSVRMNLNYRGFETPNFGNTGYQLLGLILERVTGKSFEQLIAENSVFGAGGSKFDFYPNPTPIAANLYTVTTGAQELGLPQNLFGIYGAEDTPHGHTAVFSRNLDNQVAVTGSGGAGSILASPSDYVSSFFRPLVNGGLLSATGQNVFNNGFVLVPDALALEIFGETGISHGFGVFKQEGAEFGTILFKTGGTIGSKCHLIHVKTSPDPDLVNATVFACMSQRDLFKGFLTAGPPTAQQPEDVAPRFLRVLGQ